jgi:nicotinate phosphoribosyltransferase
MKNNLDTNPVILPSFLDNDLYKFTMQQGVVELFGERTASYRFINRGKEKFTGAMVARLQASVNAMAELKLTPEERAYIETLGLFKPAHLDYLQNFRYNPAQVKINLTAMDGTHGQLDMKIEGPWKEAILWEVPLMALVSQIALDEVSPLTAGDRAEFIARTLEKAWTIKEEKLNVMEFGTRRRRDFASQEAVVRLFKEQAGETFAGTSNVYLAMKYNLPVKGTMAHEWIMAHAAIFGVEKANPKALESWKRVYPGKLKIFLPDTYTTELAYATLSDNDIRYLDGMRWDSGDLYAFTDQIEARQRAAGVDPATKVIPYTDGLTIAQDAEIARKMKGRVIPTFGNGTSLTNDFATPALKIVIKMDALDGIGVAKISDTPRKASGDPKAIAEALRVIAEVRQRNLNNDRNNINQKEELNYEVA